MPLRACMVQGLPAWRWTPNGPPVPYGDGTGRSSAQAIVIAQGHGYRRAARRLHHDIGSGRLRADARSRARTRSPLHSDRTTAAMEAVMVRQLQTAQRLLVKLAGPALSDLQRDISRREDADGIMQILDVLRAIRSTMTGPVADLVAGLTFLAEEVDDDATESMDQQLSRLFTIPLASAAGSGELVNAWVKTNVSLITRMTDEALSEIERLVLDAASNGTPTLDLRATIQERFDVSYSRASLIARDQTATLASQVAEARQTAYGIDEYQWSTSGDSRVRQAHADLDGRIFPWAEGGPGGIHPGRDFGCRCVPLPVLPGDDKAALIAQAQARQQLELSILQSSPTVQGEIPNYSGFSDWNAARIEQLRLGIASAVGLPSQAVQAVSKAAWKALPTGGYSLTGTAYEGSTLARVGSDWILTTPSGSTVNLGRKASFTTAEEALLKS